MLDALLLLAPLSLVAPQEPLQPLDVFELEWASDPRVSPDGSRIVFARAGFDVMTDRSRSRLWTVGTDGSDARPLLSGSANVVSPRWSPDGERLLYVASEGGGAQIFCRWMDTGVTASLTHLTESPSSLAWSPDGEHIAFTMFVPSSPEPLASMPPKPEGAEWAEPPTVVEQVEWRSDGQGLVEEGFTHLFVLPAGGGTPRQLTDGDYDHDGRPAWTADGKALVFSAKRHDDAEFQPVNSELYRVELEDASITALTDRDGPDDSPATSPDGDWIAYTGFDDRRQGYQVRHLYLLPTEGGEPRLLTGDFDRSVGAPKWKADGSGVYFSFNNRGNGEIGFVSLAGEIEVLTGDVGGTSLGRPYSSGSYTVSKDGLIAFTQTRPDYPADVAVVRPGEDGAQRLTRLNDDLFAQRELGRVEELWTESSFDGEKIQAWVCKPPGFDPERKYPLLLEIHGGPFANYGDRFSAEVQLYAAEGYVVVYANPRGSTSYGEAFGNLIHHAYPGNDYDDLMSVVDAVVARGYVDPEQLFVTGGSGGGVLTSWIVGKTDRFRAAVVAKPVIHWTSFVLTADAYPYFTQYWFPGYPWEHQEHYWKRSPLSLVGNVSTPTMLLTGEEDHRTPISESEQFYQALKLRRIDTALVRIPGASHGIASRPSRLIAKVVHILAWFERYGESAEG
ncbi:MAG: S9 family peptidase [Planctomycetota bacterium]